MFYVCGRVCVKGEQTWLELCNHDVSSLRENILLKVTKIINNVANYYIC